MFLVKASSWLERDDTPPVGRARPLSDEKTLPASAQTLGDQRSEEKCSEEDQVTCQVIEDLLQGKQNRPEQGGSLPGHFPSQPVYQQHVKRIEIFNRDLEQRRDLCFCVGIPRT